MSLPTKDGTYKARPLEWGVRTDGTPAFVCKFDLLEHWNGTAWEQPGGDFQISGYFYPLKKDGTVNELTFNNLRDSLGWDGSGWATLNDGDFGNIEVQLVVGWEMYNGQNQIKVKFINPIDRVPGAGVGKADPQEVRSLDAQYGAVFRAFAGSTPAKSNGAKPAATAKPAAATPASAPAGKSSKVLTWTTFLGKAGDLPLDERDVLWKEALGLIGGWIGATAAPPTWNEETWAKAHEAMVKDWSPEHGLIPI